MDEKFKISEVFSSIQGEGPYVGLPALFIRFYGCNLRCSFCDSAYAITGKEYTEYSVEELVQLVRKKQPPKTIILTGGEPLLQPSRAMERLLQALPEYDFHVETNGTHFAAWLIGADCIVISPKVKHSAAMQELYELSKVYSVEVVLKFAVDVDGERPFPIRPFEDLPIFVSPIAPVPFDLSVYLERVNKLKNFIFATRKVQNVPIRLTVQLHKLLWGDQRAV